MCTFFLNILWTTSERDNWPMKHCDMTSYNVEILLSYVDMDNVSQFEVKYPNDKNCSCERCTTYVTLHYYSQ